MNQSSHNPHGECLNLLSRDSVFFEESKSLISSNCNVIKVKSSDWLAAANKFNEIRYRFVAILACHIEQILQVNVCFEKNGQYLLMRTTLSENSPEIASLTLLYPAANRAERYIHDMFGVVFINHPNLTRWIRHKAWSKQEFPLRKDFLKTEYAEKTTPADSDYPFIRIEGSGVCEVPVGPVHAGIIEPGHFRFNVAGEDVLNLEEHLGYVHKGIEKLAEGRDVAALLHLAGRISGDSTVAHTWAACQACENAANIDVPERALFIRAIMAERERVANHLGDIGAICNDVGFSFANYQFGRLRELWQRFNAVTFGHRFMMDCIVFSGVKIDLSDESIKKMKVQLVAFKKEIVELRALIKRNSSLQDRLRTTGILTPETAKKLGALGYVGRSSGQSYDARHDVKYPPYNLITTSVPIYTEGDVAARMKIRIKEIFTSLNMIDELITKLPSTKIKASTLSNTLLADTEGLGLIEGWRGEILTYISFDKEAKVSRFFPRDPSWLNWPALELLIHSNIVPDFPVCNKSVNGSYSGHDL